MSGLSLPEFIDPHEGADEEIWRPVVGYEGRYEVSSLGRVRSLSTYRPGEFHKILRPYVQNHGYHYLSLRAVGRRKKAFAVHRLVLDAFVGPCPSGMQCAHWDGDPGNNAVGNLRWATSAENHADRRRHGRIPEGEKNPAARLDLSAVRTIKRLRGVVTAYELAHVACVDVTTIDSIWNGETWRAA